MNAWNTIWSIGVFGGDSPFSLTPLECAQEPVLTGRSVTDIPCSLVADPFVLRREEGLFLFFEALNTATGFGEIAYATSENGLNWRYEGVVLREPFHLSYPHVFESEGEIFLIPETRQANSIRLYQAESFPGRWRFVRELRRGDFADATLFEFEGEWWMFAQRGLDELCLFHARSLEGDWKAHPRSPLWPGNRVYSRPGGRIFRHEGGLFRFAQDGLVSYGNNLRVMQVDRLNALEYEEHEHEASPIVRASGKGWNACGMHHVELLKRDGKWLAMVDGCVLSFV